MLNDMSVTSKDDLPFIEASCALGAIEVGSLDLEVLDRLDGQSAATTALLAHLGVASIPGFNDAAETTQDMVVDGMLEAAKKLRNGEEF